MKLYPYLMSCKKMDQGYECKVYIDIKKTL